MAGGGQPAALDRRQVAAHHVHLGDRRTAAQQCRVDGLLVGQRQALAGRHQQRGAAAGDQRDHQVVRTQAADPLGNAFGGAQAGGVGHRVRGLDDLDAARRHAMPVPGHDEAFERPARPVVLDGLRHRGRRHARAHDDRPPLRQLRQERRDAAVRQRGGDGGVEHLSQELSGGKGHGGRGVRRRSEEGGVYLSAAVAGTAGRASASTESRIPASSTPKPTS